LGVRLVRLIVQCPACRGEVSVPETLRGQGVLCPRCDGRFTAPTVFPIAAETVTQRQTPPKLPPTSDRKFCHECGSTILRSASLCPSCGAEQTSESMRAPALVPVSTNRVAAGIFGILLGVFGVHKFVLGYVGEGLVMLFVTLLTAGIGGVVMFVVGVIEGVIYLTKTDQEFHAIYEVGHKGWF
jgi:TM2 domain-containing membrane protein YozV